MWSYFPIFLYSHQGSRLINRSGSTKTVHIIHLHILLSYGYNTTIKQMHQLALVTYYRATHCTSIWKAASSLQFCGQTRCR